MRTGACAQAVGDDVGEGVAAEVAQRLGDQEQDHREADQEADGVDHPVIARRVDEAGDAEERGGRSVVAGEGEAVLDAAQAAAGGVKSLAVLVPRRAAQKVMPRLIATKTRNMPMAVGFSACRAVGPVRVSAQALAAGSARAAAAITT